MAFTDHGRSGGRASGGSTAIKTCYDRALDLLARRIHFRKELRGKLLDRRYDAEEVEGVLARLEERGFLNDAQAARAFVREKLIRGPVGERRLRAELQRRGVDGEIADRALSELMPADERDTVAEAARRWLRGRGRRYANGLDERGRRSLAGHLQRKGFSSHVIFSVLDELEAGELDEDEDSSLGI